MAMLPYDERDGFIWFDGKLVPWREATTHVLTHSLHYGLAVFEGVSSGLTAEAAVQRAEALDQLGAQHHEAGNERS